MFLHFHPLLSVDMSLHSSLWVLCFIFWVVFLQVKPIFHLNVLIHVQLLVNMPGVGLMVRVVGLGSEDPDFKSPLAVELIPGGVDSTCHDLSRTAK